MILRHVLKTANRHGWLPFLPDLSAPYKTSGKITHRAWFSPSEYKQLYEATRARAKNAEEGRWQGMRALHDYVLFMANTGLRPDEAARLEYRDVAIVTDEATGERILEIEVRGKRGVGYCKSTTGAVMPFERLRKRNGAEAQRIAFSARRQRELFNAVLDELNLQIRPGRQSTDRLQSQAHVHLHAPDGRRRHLPNCQELPHQRRDDREILRFAHQEHAWTPPRSTFANRNEPNENPSPTMRTDR